MKYAIVEISGRQFWVEKGKYYDLNRIPTELGKEIGLKNSFFTNSTGWPDPQHLMTVEDLLTLSIRTIKDFPK